MTREPLKVGFVGPGILGAPITTYLLASGHQLFVYTLGKIPIAIAESSATKCVTARGVAERAEVIITMVPEPLDAQSALFGIDGVAAGLSRGKVVVDMSSNSRIVVNAFAQKINALGCNYLEASVPHGESAVGNATLSIVIGGAEAAFERVKPLLARISKNIRFEQQRRRSDHENPQSDRH
ncbi:NAD(P)-dependent oxidoreductase [Variovorax sp. RA8]|uniref:NAD(P)-dependent oxidoreductase n=1 Tax=Variovorax sp. (strain JCM 16519 / RA8) TaxID=662548 RepID=UPI000ABD21A8|nr:NAD(P)-binding domain-containing protein [Variovorax sp. RA8]VTU14430.1 2-hydroxy-3-oxopropionate reductase [Variovorax sp. RA8]